MIIDNAAFHSSKDVLLPENIILIPIPLHWPELNSADKIRQRFKSKISMKTYKSLDQLEEKLLELIKKNNNDKVESIISYEYLVNNYYDVFN